MKNQSKHILMITSLFVMAVVCSCEGAREAKGSVYDADTKAPLDSVLCTVLTGSEARFTDSVGHFTVRNNFGGCMPSCPDIEVEFSKKGYQTKKMTNVDGDKIFLEKE